MVAVAVAAAVAVAVAVVFTLLAEKGAVAGWEGEHES